MRILYIDVNCRSGSTGKIVYDLYSRARAGGHTAAICYGRGKIVDGENIFKFGLDWETRAHALLTRLTGWTGCFSPLSTRRLLSFIDRFQPDLVHIHELHAYFVNLRPLLLYLAERRIPVVQTMHCEFSYTGKCGHAYDCRGWEEDCGHCPRLREYPKTLWFDHTAAMLREKRALYGGIEKLVLTAPSKWLADRAARSFLKGRDIRVVHNGIDTEGIFHPWDSGALRERHGLAVGEKVVLAVAPDLMSTRKGGRWVARLAEAMPDVRFILIGVKDLSEAFPKNAVPLGPVYDQKLLAQYYSLADCFVICSEKENFPTTCLEAFCCGTPVAGFSEGGTSETVPAPYGRFCAAGHLDALEGAVRTQLDRAWDRSALAREAAELYSSASMYRGYQAIYQEMAP